MAKSKKKAPLIELRQRKNSEGIMTGANTELYLDGKKISNATAVKIEVAANGVAKATVELIGNIVFSGKIGRLEKIGASLKSIVEN